MIRQEVLDTFRNKRALVTGGTGLIGRQVVDILCKAGANVTIVSMDRIKVHENAEHLFGDLTDFSFCRSLTKNKDLVCHLAGIKGSASVSTTMLASHFIPTLMMNTNVLEACRLNEVPKVVYTSSIGAYAATDVFLESDYRLDTEPMDFAGWSKRMAELQIHAYHVQYGLENFAVVRPANVYGPGDNFDPENAMVIPTLMWRIFNGEDPVVVWGDGSAIRDFAYSRDVAEGVLLALHYGTRGGFVNLGCGEGVSIRQLIEALHSFLNFNYVFDKDKPSGYPKRVMDITLARNTIDYHPSTTLEEGLRNTWEWFIENKDEYRNKQNYFKKAI